MGAKGAGTRVVKKRKGEVGVKATSAMVAVSRERGGERKRVWHEGG